MNCKKIAIVILLSLSSSYNFGITISPKLMGYLTTIYFIQGEILQAWFIKKFHSKYTDHVAVTEKLAETYEKHGEIDKALEIYQKAINLNSILGFPLNQTQSVNMHLKIIGLCKLNGNIKLADNHNKLAVNLFQQLAKEDRLRAIAHRSIARLDDEFNIPEELISILNKRANELEFRSKEISSP